MAKMIRPSYECTFVWFILAQLLVVIESEGSPELWNRDSAEPLEGISVKSSEIQSVHRLPQTVEPVAYRLNISTQVGKPGGIELKHDLIEGIVAIDMIVKESTSSITLHSKNLTISKFNLTKFGKSEKVESLEKGVDSARDFLIFKRMNGSFEPGTYTLTIEYSGELRDDYVGFSKGEYFQNKWTYYAASSFGPVYARTAFPCFDEPSFKSKFTIGITHYKNYIAQSNTPNISISKPDRHEMVTTIFKETPRMSTYSVILFAYHPEFRSNIGSNSSVLCWSGLVEKSKSLLQVGIEVLKELDVYTGIPYSNYMERIDLVARYRRNGYFPDNWGLIAYRNELGGIGEEIAHQWFGSLVSIKWWTSIWWSAGISTFLGAHILDKIKPKLRTMENLVIDHGFEGALEGDSCDGQALSHSLKPNELLDSGIFESPRSKGSVIIRMMQHFLTDSVFQRGLQNFLDKKKESSADSDDLFQLIDEVAKANEISASANKPDSLGKIMDGWINRPGYPLLTVTRNYSDSTLHIAQEAFVRHVNVGNCSNTWQVPINFATTTNMDFNDTKSQFWLTNTSVSMKINATSEDWVILNKQATGYYRVNYDETNWMLIINHLKSSRASRESIHVLNRAQLMYDALALVKADRLSLSILLDLITAWEDEKDYIAWLPAYDSIWWLKERLKSTEYYTSFKDYIERINKTMDAELTKSIKERKEDHLAGIVRPALVQKLFDHKVWSGDHDLRSLFHLIANQTPYGARLSVALCGDYRYANYSEIDGAMKNFSKYAMEWEGFCFPDSTGIQSYLKFTNGNDSQSGTADESSISVISIIPKLGEILKKWPYTGPTPGGRDEDLIDFIAYGITTEAQINELKKMDESAQGEQKTLTSKILGEAEDRYRWLRKNERAIIEWTKKIDQAATKRLK